MPGSTRVLWPRALEHPSRIFAYKGPVIARELVVVRLRLHSDDELGGDLRMGCRRTHVYRDADGLWHHAAARKPVLQRSRSKYVQS